MVCLFVVSDRSLLTWPTFSSVRGGFGQGFGPFTLDAGEDYNFALWGRSSAGRASRSQCEGREFDPPRLHQTIRVGSVPALSMSRAAHASEARSEERRVGKESRVLW